MKSDADEKQLTSIDNNDSLQNLQVALDANQMITSRKKQKLQDGYRTINPLNTKYAFIYICVINGRALCTTCDVIKLNVHTYIHTYIHTYFIDFPFRGFSKTIQ